ncbi:MAG TPA: thioesterase family protein [Verrucomicrobiae bacterium]|nr:thioesterase family protein [Verrucomicrobiae bacterium]
MKSVPGIGTTGETTFVVEQKHCIEFASDGMPAVLSTPHLIGILERTARLAIVPFLEADERSVGVELDLKHLAPSPLGATVTATARVIGHTGRLVDFQIEARDEHELIVRGVHRRAVVSIASFVKRLQAKGGGPGTERS